MESDRSLALGVGWRRRVATALVLASLIAACRSESAGSPRLGQTRQPLVETAGAMTSARGKEGCGLLGSGKLLWAGSDSPMGSYLSSSEIYDPTTNMWTAGDTLAQGRWYGAVATLANGDLLVAGGYQDAVGGISEVERYQQSTGRFATKQSMHRARYQHALTTLADGRVLATGTTGVAADGQSAEIYDPGSDVWLLAPSMTAKHAGHVVLTLRDGRIFVIGDGASKNADIADGAVSAWRATQAAVSVHDHPQALELVDGRVLVIGGADGAGNAQSTTEIYDPIADRWDPGPTMSVARYGAAGIRLASGAMVIAGGESSGLVERIDPAGHGFVKVGTLTEPRWEPCAAPIPGGAIFAGGSGSGFVSNDYTTSADRYLGALVGQTCTTNDDCASAACVGGSCVAAVDAGPDVADASSDAADADAGADADAQTITVGPSDAMIAESPATPPPIEAGVISCARDAECKTGHCVGGVCCDSACTATCHSCVLPGSVGVCTPEPLGVDESATCGPARSCSATCDGHGGCTTAVAGSQCAPSRCISETRGVGAAYCTDNAGRCGDPTPFDCTPYACQVAVGACMSSCASSGDCAGGYVCDDATKSCVASSRGGAGGCSIGAGPARGIGAHPLALAMLGLGALSGRARWRRRMTLR